MASQLLLGGLLHIFSTILTLIIHKINVSLPLQDKLANLHKQSSYNAPGQVCFTQ